jgi:hypothetical protein
MAEELLKEAQDEQQQKEAQDEQHGEKIKAVIALLRQHEKQVIADLGECRIVRVKNCPGEHLHMQQVEVYDYRTGKNVAPKGKASESNSCCEGEAFLTIDGCVDQYQWWPSCGHTANGQEEWWQVELNEPTLVSSVVVFNRNDGCQERLRGAKLQVIGGRDGETILREFELGDQRRQEFRL